IKIEKPKVHLENQGRRHSRYEMKELPRKDISRRYRKEIRKGLEECAVERQEDEIEQQWSKIESAINKATDKTLSKRIAQKKKEWLDNTCIKEIEKKQLRLRYLQTGREEDKRRY
ncbi:hypothetical protein ILUMI_14671, partial [Ignelater luminosus]